MNTNPINFDSQIKSGAKLRKRIEIAIFYILALLVIGILVILIWNINILA
jgi:hypothetical protein